MSAECIGKIGKPPSLNREERKIFLILVTVAKEATWGTRLKHLKTGMFLSIWSRSYLSGKALIDLFKYHFEEEGEDRKGCAGF